MDEHERIENELDRLGLDPKWRGRYWTIHCPSHEDKNKSAVCFEDGWIHCFAGCPGKHINQLSGNKVCSYNVPSTVRSPNNNSNFTDFWITLDTIPEDQNIKGVPAKVLNKLGWRIFPEGTMGGPGGYFIPYFDTKREKVRYYQVRHYKGADRRFTFPRDCSPICYGLECLPKCDKYLCFTEGSRDSVILRMCGIPAVAIPSASSKTIVDKMCKYAQEHSLILVCIADRDEAGDRLIKNINIPFIDDRTPVGKDVGEFFEEKGLEEIRRYYGKYRK